MNPQLSFSQGPACTPEVPAGQANVEPSWVPGWGGGSLLPSAWTRVLVSVPSIASSIHTPLHSPLLSCLPSPLAPLLSLSFFLHGYFIEGVCLPERMRYECAG